MAGYATFPVAGPYALAGFLLFPIGAWLFAFVSGLRAWRRLTSQPLEAPPRVRARLVRWMYATVIADPVAFGVGLWLLWTPSVQAIQAGGSLESIGAALLVLEWSCLAFSASSWVVAISQALVFDRRIRDFVGPASARAMKLLLFPILGGVLALVAGLQGMVWAGAFLADPTIASVSVADPVMFQFLVFLCSMLAILGASVVASRSELSTQDGIRAASLVSFLGLLPPLAAVLWIISQAPAP